MIGADHSCDNDGNDRKVEFKILLNRKGDGGYDDRHDDDGKVELGSLLHRLGVQSIIEITSALPLAQTSH